MNSSAAKEQSDKAAQCFSDGSAAMEQQDWDTAVARLSEAVRLNPRKTKYRELKHRSCRRRHEKSGGVSMFDRVKLIALRTGIKAAESRGDWATVDQLAESVLEKEPLDAAMYAHIAAAAAEAGNNSLALYAYRFATKLDARNSAWLRSMGAILEVEGELMAARDCYEKMLAINPSDHVAKDLISAVDIAVHMNRSRDQPFRRDPTSSQPPPVVDPKLAGFVALAEEHTRKQEHAKALEAFKRAVALSPDDAALRAKSEEAEIAVLKQRATEARAAATASPDSTELRDEADRLEAKRYDRELKILAQRAHENPEDLLHTYRLADCYRRAGRYEIAVPTYVKACANPRLRAESSVGIGECAVRLGNAKLAEKRLDAVLLQIDPAAKPNTFKLAHYWLGRLFEKQKQYAKAAEHYQVISEIDRKFKDIRKRLKILFTITWP